MAVGAFSPEVEKRLGKLFDDYREKLKDVYVVAEEIQKFGFSLPWVNAPNGELPNPASFQTRANKMRLEIRPGLVGTDQK